jgi:hypothetical protein
MRNVKTVWLNAALGEYIYACPHQMMVCILGVINRLTLIVTSVRQKKHTLSS